MKASTKLLTTISALMLLFSAQSQVLPNGSFEVTTAPVGCNYNLSNAVFNGYYTDIEAFGAGNETDIIMDGCYVTDIPDGVRSISIAHFPPDEVSIPIDAPLTIGETYTLSFWALGETTFRPLGPLEIGESTSATAFGTNIYTVTPSEMTWSNYTFTFVASVAATHITVRNFTMGDTYWNHVDHFEFIVPDDVLEIESTDASCFGVCDGEATVVVGDLPPYTFLWDDGSTTGTVTDLCAGSYSVEVTNGAGDVETLDVTIEEPDELIPSVTAISHVTCNGLMDGSFEAEALGGTGDYTFTIGDGFPDPVLFEDLAAGIYTLTVEDENGCTTDLPVEITEPSVLTLTEIAVVDVTCNGGADGSIEVTAGGGTPGYTYSLDGGIFGAATVFTDLAAGTYTITVQDDNTCETDLDVIVNEPDAIDVIEVVVDESCLDECDGSIDLSASGGTGTFLYSIDDCASTQPDGLFTDLCASDYNICITDEAGCTYNSTITVEPGESEGDPTITAFGPLCENDPAIVLDAVTVGVFSGPGVSGTTFDPEAAGPGVHTITNTITDGCGAVATFDVQVNAIPNVSFIGDQLSGCQPLTVNFDNTGDPGVSCEWYFGDGSIATGCGAASHVYEFAGDYDVTLQLTDANGCSSSATYNDYINVYPIPNANFSLNPNPVTTNNPVVEFEDLSDGADSWLWIFGEEGTAFESDPTFSFPPFEGTHDVQLIITSEYGCKDSITKVLRVNQEQLIFVPNTITPDGDAFNEVFKPYMTGIDIYDYHLTIFNRWGEIIFESYDLSKGWNGTYGGEIVQDDVYIWQITTADIATDKKLEFNGHVTVIK